VWWIAYVAAALAHSPHDVASVLSLAPDGTVLTNDSNVLAASSDDGHTFDMVTWASGEPLCAIALSATNWLVADPEGSLWWTGDAGATWATVSGPDGLTACTEGPQGVVVGGPTGLWRGADGDAFVDLTVELEAAPVALAQLGSDALIGVDLAGGSFRVTSDGALEFLEPRDALSVAVDADRVLIGRSGAPPILSEDGGDTWLDLDAGPESLRVLAIAGEEILGASAEEAVWWSGDLGASWELSSDGLDPLAEGAGGPGDGVHYFQLRIDGERHWLGSFEGLYWRDPDDTRWRQGALDTIPRVRTVAWLPDGELLVGAYGGGVYRGGEDLDWHEVAAPIGWPWPKQIFVAPEDPDHWFVVSGSALYFTEDAGETWDTHPVLLGEAGDAVAPAPGFPLDSRLVVAGRTGEGEGAVAWSSDGGTSWTASVLPGTCRQKPTDIVWTDEAGLWIACGTDGQLHRSDDGGQSWSGATVLDAQVEALIPGEGVVWAATRDGLWEVSSSGASQVDFAGETLTSGALWDGGVLVAVVGRGLVHWSDSGAEALGWPSGDFVEDVAVADDGRLAVGLRSGAWWSADDGLTWALACPYDRVDDQLQHWWLESWAPTSVDSAMRGIVQAGEAGATAELTLDGRQLRLIGSTRGEASVRVTVNGDAEELELDLPEPGSLLWAADVDDGVHTVQIEVLSGTLLLDGAERWRADAPPFELDGDTGGPGTSGRTCGCRGQSGAALIPILLAGWRRRRAERPDGGDLQHQSGSSPAPR